MGIKIKYLIAVFLILGINSVFSQGAVIASDNSKTNFEKTYQIVLMLPFCFGNDKEWKLRDAMADYYEGVEMAIEDLRKQGMNLNLIVLDSKKDSLEVINLLKTKVELQKSDLFIGPVYEKELVEVEKFCSIYKIPLVSPFNFYNKKLKGDFPLINCSPNDSMGYYYKGACVAKAFKHYQVIVVHTDSAKKTITSAARNFKSGYEKASGKTCTIINGKQSPKAFWNGKDSLLIYYTGKHSSACNSALANNGNSKWKVAGSSDWLDVERTNYNVFNGVYFIDNYSVPYNDTTYKKMRKTFRTKYGGDPQRYTFVGYDQFMFFSNSLMALDHRFADYILNRTFRLNHNNFHFVNQGDVMVNSGTNIYYYYDYKFYKAYWRY